MSCYYRDELCVTVSIVPGLGAPAEPVRGGRPDAVRHAVRQVGHPALLGRVCGHRRLPLATAGSQTVQQVKLL